MLLLGSFSIQGMIAIVVAALIGMTIHEYAHNYVGYLMGDPTPAQMGKLTLDPRAHINWFGFAMFVLIGFGILGTAPISAYRMRNPRWGYLAAVAAGPLSNLLLAVVFALIFRILLPTIIANQLSNAVLLFNILVTFNVLLFVFNILPFFPLDGWSIVLALLPPDLARKWGSPQWRMYSQYAFFGLILLSFIGGPINILGTLIGEPTFTLTRLLMGY
ncbi:MAG: site-2 protease family protein [Anaerolineae bacterium]|nr:site-2 protease family protein [Anaerolineae bacterium]